MAFQKEAPIYLQVRRSNLENIGIKITDPYDYIQVVPFVTCFINTVQDQYFKTAVIETLNDYNYKNSNASCPNQVIKIYYKLDELTVGGSSPYTPVLYSYQKGLLAASQEFIGVERNLGCYSTGSAPVDPTKFTMVFKPYSEPDPTDPTKFIVYDLMSPHPHPFIVVDSAPGYDAISFVKDNDSDPDATAPGYFIFRIFPLVDIQLNP